MELQKRFVVEEAAKGLQEKGFPLTSDDIKELELIAEDLPKTGTLTEASSRLVDAFLNRKFHHDEDENEEVGENEEPQEYNTVYFTGFDSKIAVNGVLIPEVQAVVWNKKLINFNKDERVIGELRCLVFYDDNPDTLKTESSMEEALAQGGDTTLVITYADELGNQAVDIFINPVFLEVRNEMSIDQITPLEAYVFKAEDVWRGRIPPDMNVWLDMETLNKAVLSLPQRTSKSGGQLSEMTSL